MVCSWNRDRGHYYERAWPETIGGRVVGTGVTLLLSLTLLVLCVSDRISAALSLPFLPEAVTSFGDINVFGFFPGSPVHGLDYRNFRVARGMAAFGSCARGILPFRVFILP
ncbi:MAG: hypothetical protein ACLFR1_09375 [Spirochaetia bacterium]